MCITHTMVGFWISSSTTFRNKKDRASKHLNLQNNLHQVHLLTKCYKTVLNLHTNAILQYSKVHHAAIAKKQF